VKATAFGFAEEQRLRAKPSPTKVVLLRKFCVAILKGPPLVFAGITRRANLAPLGNLRLKHPDLLFQQSFWLTESLDQIPSLRLIRLIRLLIKAAITKLER
jgi:hypothetical protein